MEPDPNSNPLLLKCERLLALLYANRDHRKLRNLIADIEDLRDRVIAADERVAERP